MVRCKTNIFEILKLFLVCVGVGRFIKGEVIKAVKLVLSVRDTTTHKMDHSNLLLYRTFPWLSTLRVLLNLLDRGDSFKSIQLIIKSYDARSHKLERILDFCIK